MKPKQPSSERDLFGTEPSGLGPLLLEIRGIAVPQNKSRKDQVASKTSPPNYHVPSFKNSKMLVAKGPNGRPLERPFLITKPEFAKWMDLAMQSFESQLLSKCQTGSDGIPAVRSKLFSMLSLLPADDSVNDLKELILTVERVNPGEEGATITIERLT